MTEEQEPFVFDWTILQSKRPKFDPQPPEDDTVPPLSDCDGDQCTIGASYHPDFNGKASTTKREPSYKVKLSASTPDGTTYEQDTDIEWTPPPNTAVLVATMKKDEGAR